MQLDKVTVPRVAVPILIALGYALYVIFDSSNGDANRGPAIIVWTLAGLCILAYHIMNRKAPKHLLIASAASLAISIGILIYVINFVEGFGGIAWFMIGVLPFGGLAVLLFALSIYVPMERSKSLQ